jgi:hypothetical protein
MTIPSRVQAGQYGAVNNGGRRRKLPEPIILLKGPAQGLEHTNDRALDATQQRSSNATQSSRANPLTSSNFIQGLSLTAGVPLIVEHGLGRPFTSAFMCGQSVTGDFSFQRPSSPTRPPSTQNTLDTRQIVVTFNGVGTCIADMVVF